MVIWAQFRSKLTVRSRASSTPTPDTSPQGGGEKKVRRDQGVKSRDLDVFHPSMCAPAARVVTHPYRERKKSAWSAGLPPGEAAEEAEGGWILAAAGGRRCRPVVPDDGDQGFIPARPGRGQTLISGYGCLF